MVWSYFLGAGVCWAGVLYCRWQLAKIEERLDRLIASILAPARPEPVDFWQVNPGTPAPVPAQVMKEGE